MSDPSFFFAERLMDLNVEEAFREVQGDVLAWRATEGERNWQHRACRWLLARLGHLLVAAGEWLVEYGLPRSMPVGRPRDV